MSKELYNKMVESLKRLKTSNIPKSLKTMVKQVNALDGYQLISNTHDALISIMKIKKKRMKSDNKIDNVTNLEVEFDKFVDGLEIDNKDLLLAVETEKYSISKYKRDMRTYNLHYTDICSYCLLVEKQSIIEDTLHLYHDCNATKILVQELINVLDLKIRTITKNQCNITSLWVKENEIMSVNLNKLIYWLFTGYMPPYISRILKKAKHSNFTEKSFMNFVVLQVTKFIHLINTNKKRFDNQSYLLRRKSEVKRSEEQLISYYLKYYDLIEEEGKDLADTFLNKLTVEDRKEIVNMIEIDQNTVDQKIFELYCQFVSVIDDDSNRNLIDIVDILDSYNSEEAEIIWSLYTQDTTLPKISVQTKRVISIHLGNDTSILDTLD